MAQHLDKDRIRRSFDRAAATYDAHARVQERLATELVARAGGEPQRILELGCGTGTLTALLRSRFPEARIVAVDFAEEMAARTRARVPDAEVIVADVEQLDLEEPFDLTISAATIQWLADPAATLARLAPAGRLLLATFGPRTFWQLRATGIEPTLHLRSAAEWEALLPLEVESEELDVVYPGARAFLRTLKRTGTANAGRGDPGALARALRLYDERFAVPGGVVATYELLFLASPAP